jgi:hypothetical protein
LNSADYSITAADGPTGSGLFYQEYGAGVITEAGQSTSSYDQDQALLGLIPVTLRFTTGPISGVTLPWGFANGVSGITSDSSRSPISTGILRST